MKLSEADFKEQFDIAIKDLLAYNNIQSAANKYVLSSRANLLELTKTWPTCSGTTYYAASRSIIPTSCALRLKAVKETKQHRKELGCKRIVECITERSLTGVRLGVGLAASLSLLLQNWLKQRKEEDAQVKELVAISLAKLQDKVSVPFDGSLIPQLLNPFGRNTFIIQNLKSLRKRTCDQTKCAMTSWFSYLRPSARIFGLACSLW
jgi:hypothetical protein